jgi:hypothetical protein
MADREAKRRRLASVVGLKGVTAEALAAIMKNLHEQPMEPLSAWQINNFVSTKFREVQHTISLPLEKGGSWDWQVCRLDRLLQCFINESTAFRDVISAALRSSTARELDVVLYLDEITPGNVLRPDNQRKFWSFYLGIKNSPTSTLCREEYWLPLAVLRTTMAHKVMGDISNCTRLLLRSFLLEPCNAATVGFPINLNDSFHLIQLKVSSILADEAALKAVFRNKGAAGLRPCFLCRNIVSLGSNLVSGQNYFHEITCADSTLFDPATDETIWETYDRLEASKPIMGKAAFEALEKASGFGYHKDSLLADHELRQYIRPAKCYTMDWMHNFVVHGVASVEITALLAQARQELGVTYQQLDNFVRSAWSWPYKEVVHKVDEVFSAGRARSASEGSLTNYRILSWPTRL